MATAKEALDRIRCLTTQGADVDQFVDEIHALVSIMKNALGSVIEPGQLLYRATKHHKSVPRHIREIAAPPADKITCLGRCNRVGQPMFYCSSDKNCVLTEITPSVGDLVVRATWKTTQRMVLQDIGFTDKAFERAGASRRLPDKYSQFANKLDDDAKLIRDYLADAFTDRTSKNYALTAAIAEVHLRSDDIVGLMYPSITRDGTADNLALQPGVVSRGMRLIEAEAVRVKVWNETAPDAYGVADLAAVDADGTLVWSHCVTELTHVPKDQPGAMWIKPDEIITIQGDENAEIGLNGHRYVVSPGYTIRLENDKITVRDRNGALLDPV